MSFQLVVFGAALLAIHSWRTSINKQQQQYQLLQQYGTVAAAGEREITRICI